MKYNQNSSVPSETQREGITGSQKWACGLIDGDGHIGIEWTNKAKTRWVPLLKISLDIYNARAIYKLKAILQCGQVTRSKNEITLRVRRKDHWRNRLFPLWSGFPLRSNKYYAALYVQQAIEYNNRSCLTQNEKLKTIFSLKTALKQSQTTSLPCPVWSDSVGSFNNANLKKILDHDWLAGFIEAEGSFYILSNGQHGFGLGQTYNRHIILAIHKYFNIDARLKITKSNNLYIDTKNKMALYQIANAVQGRLLGIKSFEFALWLRTLRKQNRIESLKARQIIRQMNHTNPLSDRNTRYSP